MLKKILNIHNIRNLHNFTCDYEFDVKNVIYALNGAGKTNLSRFFDVFKYNDLDSSSFEHLKSLEAEEANENIKFKLQIDDSTIISEYNLKMPDKKKILVYNREFLDRNIGLDDFSKKEHEGAISLGIVGERQSIINQLKTDINEAINKKEEIKEQISNELDKLAKSKQKEFGGKVVTYTNILNYEKFEDSNFIDEIRAKDSLSNAEKNYKEIENIDISKQITGELNKLTIPDFEELKKVLFKSFKFEDIEEEVEQHINKVTKKWIETGLKYHAEESEELCPFCRQSTKEIDIIKKYNAYIDSLKSRTKDSI